jgi:hypothetical protein
MEILDLILVMANGALFVQFLVAGGLGIGCGFATWYLGFHGTAPYVAGIVFITSFSALLILTIVRSKRTPAEIRNGSRKIT